MKYGAIAGGEKSTVHAASVILENGGNAFDAAVGAVFTSMVSEYNLTGAGGGGARGGFGRDEGVPICPDDRGYTDLSSAPPLIAGGTVVA